MNKLYSILLHQYDRINRLFDSCRKEGIVFFLKRVLIYGKELFFLRYDGYLLEMEPLGIIFKPPHNILYEIEELQEAVDLSHLFIDLTRENVRYRIRNGEYGFIVKYDERIIGTLWLTNKPIYFPGFVFRIASRSNWINLDMTEGFVYRGAIDKEFSGNKIFVALFNSIITKAKDLELKKIITSMGIDNIAARKQAQRAGWKVKHLVICKRICGLLFRELSIDDNCSKTS